MKTMKSCYLDANLLVYYQDRKSPFYDQTKLIIANLLMQGFELLISPLALDEYEYTVWRSFTTSKAEIIKNLRIGIRKIMKIPGIKLINPPLEFKRHLKVLNLMAKYQLKPRDAYHLFIMLENKVKYLTTFDHDFDLCFEKGLVKAVLFGEK